MKTIFGILLIGFVMMMQLGMAIPSITNPEHTASSTTSTEFYLVYSDNYKQNNTASLFITSKQSTYGVVEIPGLAWKSNFTILANSMTTVSIPATAMLDGSDKIGNLGIHITASNQIVVYQLNPGVPVYSNDAFVALPVSSLGTEYIAISWADTLAARGLANSPSELAIVAPYNNTNVTITPSVTTGKRAAGIPYTITLNQYQTYTLQTDSAYEDITGTIITSSLPVAAFSGNECVDIPAGYGYCDHTVEQLLPTSQWGKSFVTIPMASRENGDIIRVLAMKNNTTVHITGGAAPFTSTSNTGAIAKSDDTPEKSSSETKTNNRPTNPFVTTQSTHQVSLNRGKYANYLITAPVEIKANQPILVAQFATGEDYGGLGDPLMMLIPPAEQFLNQYTFLVPSGYSTNYINIISPTSNIFSIYLDGSRVNAAGFHKIGSSGFSGASIILSTGSHTISGIAQFGIYVYGFGSYVSYGYPGGLGTKGINIPPPSKTPVILIPGIGGTTLVNNQGEQWVGIKKLCDDANSHSLKAQNDHLDVLRLNQYGTAPLFPNIPAYNTARAGSVILNATGHCTLKFGITIIDEDLVRPVYQSLFDYLTSQGYPVHLFPYDWRRDLSETSSKLDKFIDEHRNGGKINIIAHSMGGLVARNYILDEGRANKVQNIITLGTPYLGTPLAYKALNSGYDLNINESIRIEKTKGFSIVRLINEEKMKELFYNWPGVYELLPGERFFEVYENGYVDEDVDINNDGKTLDEVASYADMKGILEGQVNNNLVKTSEAFRTNTFETYANGSYGVKIFIVVGLGQQTKRSVRFWARTALRYPFPTAIYQKWENDNGDGTVLQRSADLKDDDTDLQGDAIVYYAKAEHGDLPKVSAVQQQIHQIFSTGNLTPVNDDISYLPKWNLNGKQVNVYSPVDLHVYDELGNHLGPDENGVIEYGIPGASYDIFDHSKSVFVPDGIKYKVVLKGTDQGNFDMEILEIQDGNKGSTALFKEIPVTTRTMTRLQLNNNPGYIMDIDQNGDGQYDLQATPSILTPAQTEDTTPPTSTIFLDGEKDSQGFYVGDVIVTISAEDNPDGTGVARIEYTITKGRTVQVYTQPFVISADEVEFIYSKAIDIAGNEQYPLTKARVGRSRRFIPLFDQSE